VVQPAPATRRGRAHRPHHDPHAGKPHGEELAGIHSARLGREWRVLYEIDEARGRRARHPAPLERLPPAMTVATGTAG
jgi:hypothetical protein